MPRAFKAKKLILVLATSALVTDASKEAPEVILDWVFCVHYPVQFHKDKEIIWALIDSSSEVNTMTPAYAKKLGLRIQRTDIRTQKIDGSSSDKFGMIIIGLQFLDKQDKAWFF